MPYPKYWTEARLEKLKSLYDSGLSMREVGEHLGKSVWAINSAMKRKKISRRAAHVTRNNQFFKLPLSFTPKLKLTNSESTLKTAGLMLYWAEGGKKNISGIDFANSDPRDDKTVCEIFTSNLSNQRDTFKSISILIQCFTNERFNYVLVQHYTNPHNSIH